MKRNTSGGGKSTLRRRGSSRSAEQRHRKVAADTDAIDIESPEYERVDWDSLPRRAVDLDPALVEEIRARHLLKQLTLRVGTEQIEEARRVASQTGAKYQAVLRRWLAEGASRSRAERIGSQKPRRRSA